MKGGVAKTTLSVNMAYALAKIKGKKVLLVDVDPQFNATQYLIGDAAYVEYIKKGGHTIHNLFFPIPEQKVTTVRKKQMGQSPAPTLKDTTLNIYEMDDARLDLLPSSLKLLEAEMMPRGREASLRNFLHKTRNAYDFIFIDCPPTISVFTLSAYLASDEYLVPVKPDPLSTVGLPLLEKVMAEYNKNYGYDVKQIGIIPTMLRETALMRDTLADLRSKRPKSVFINGFSYSTYIAEAVSQNKPLFDYKPAERYGEEIIRIVDEFLEVQKEVDANGSD